MKVNGQTIILDAGELITIKAQEATQQSTPVVEQPVQQQINDTDLKDNQIKIIIKNDMAKSAVFTGYLRLGVSGMDFQDLCFRNNRHYPIDNTSGKYLYTKGNKVDGYKHGANTESLAPGQSMAITYTKRMECHSSSNVSVMGDISAFFGQYFQLGDIKLSVAIDRTIDGTPNRVDEYPLYYGIRFVDANGKPLTSNPQIKSKGVYYLSIYETKSLYNPGWIVTPHEQTNSSDIINTDYVSVKY